MNNVRIEAEHIAFSYGGPPALQEITLSIEAGELFAVVGHSGSGKTTLLRIMAGLEQPSSGTILINGSCVNDIPMHQRNVGMVFQNFSLWPHMSVYENIVFGIPRKELRSEKIQARIARLLGILGIAETRDVRPDCLSIGQQQRVALARALMTEPRLLLLDDPFSNLEHELRMQMRRDLRTLQRKLGITVLFVTHDLEDAFSIADRMAVLGHGKILQIGTPVAIYDFPNSVEVARFVGLENFLPGSVRHGNQQLIEFCSEDLGILRWAAPDRPPEGPSTLSIRPNALHICPIDSFRDGRYAWLEGSIETSEFLGETVRYHVAVGNTRLSIKHPHFLGSPATPSGTPVLIGFDPLHARLFPGTGTPAESSAQD